MPSQQLRVAIIGCTGFSGRNITIELVNRGHKVTGIARSPEKIGTNYLFTPLAIDVVQVPKLELAAIFANHDVVVK